MVPASQGLEGELMVFFDALAGLCAREMAKALQDKDADRASGIIEGLATMLGRSIARSCAGDAAEIDRLLTAVEQHIAAAKSLRLSRSTPGELRRRIDEIRTAARLGAAAGYHRTGVLVPIE